MKVFIIIAVKDELTQSFLTPQFVEDIAIGQRIFATQINTIPLWKENSSDFSLYQLGTFDQESGIFTSDIQKIANGRSVMKGEE